MLQTKKINLHQNAREQFCLEESKTAIITYHSMAKYLNAYFDIVEFGVDNMLTFFYQLEMDFMTTITNNNIEQVILDNLKLLPPEKQQEVLDFIQFIQHKLNHSQVNYNNQLSLKEIARLPIVERHKLLTPSIDKTAEDFLNDPELTEFFILDGEDWETGDE
ncbi:MAG: hypothetical protein O4861_09410 [Trichodesmium sp. St16_bin4-tuft]|nr:DUF2281 domain-containing protein [Trichodesmium sp. MAG_R01]MDE5069899.1 hypothetical protein [Trichodesmium sp. St4_bin8_1]MDE5072758.1 hypothetical protein [Trichodesmium sp. St5_bin8]MDE5078205.1 hypothetical protein [Trichodesmium sp. St2_bin6]MDE5090607.1 hypothetical protein [Trichodesmium sp. St18_bin3_1_1]MDE5098537.1 hypothetical protein [Trichodesmium sp. St16_bin4-tuft]MDE5103559.1 hypothetical protein [Trichodesmium sp. St19_bin2]